MTQTFEITEQADHYQVDHDTGTAQYVYIVPKGENVLQGLQDIKDVLENN